MMAVQFTATPEDREIVARIARHLDRRTGKLTGMFRPCFVKKEVAI